MRDEIRASLTRHLPGYEVRFVALLGEGLDNAVCAVSGEFTVREYKRGPAGAWHDGLLMDLLKEELRC